MACHREFLDISGDDPRQALAEQLVADCGSSGVIYAYNMGFEKGVIRELAELVPHLNVELMLIHDRIDDLLPICRRYYYHPSQQGSWSLKAVLPAMCSELNYQDLFLDPQKKRGAVRPELRIFRNVSPRDEVFHTCLSVALTEEIRQSVLASGTRAG